VSRVPARDIIKPSRPIVQEPGETTFGFRRADLTTNNLIYSGQCIHDAVLKPEVRSP
jgi:hypothetical protein